MKRIFLCFFFVFLILFSTLSATFAVIKLDGSTTAAELENTNVQIQCNNGDSGCGLYVLITSYKPLPGSSEIYLALNAELNGEEILPSGPFGFEIYIESSPVIRIYANNYVEFDSSYYDVQVGSDINFSSIRCETSIMFKNHMPENPEIYVRVIDNEGIASKMFKINTVTLESTTQEENMENSSPSLSVTKKNNEPSLLASNNVTHNSSNTNQEKSTSPNRKRSENNQTSDKTYSNTKSSDVQGDANLSQYDLSTQVVTANSPTDKKQSRLVLISAIAIVTMLLGAAVIGIKTNKRK